MLIVLVSSRVEEGKRGAEQILKAREDEKGKGRTEREVLFPPIREASLDLIYRPCQLIVQQIRGRGTHRERADQSAAIVHRARRGY